MGRHYTIQPGDVFGRLVVIGKIQDAIDPNSKKHMAQYLCRCSCPDHNTVIVKGKNLVAGKTKSCGCILRETAALLHSKTPPPQAPEYMPAEVFPNVVWAYFTMLYDAANGVDQIYNAQIPIYGAWTATQVDNIKNFYDTMYSTYEPGCKMQRIDKSIGFRPDNCFWGSRSGVPSDRINDRFIELRGCRMSVSEWNRALGYKPNTIRDRIMRGYNDIDAVFGRAEDTTPMNAVYFVNEYGRPLNQKAAEEIYDY